MKIATYLIPGLIGVAVLSAPGTAPARSAAGQGVLTAATHTPSLEACTAAENPDDPDLVAVREMFLVPGRKPSLAAIPPAALKKMAESGRLEAERAKKDWANLCKYATANRGVVASGRRPRAVLFGDSITENWAFADPTWFGGAVLDRGISGQTTSRMLLRVYADVVALRPQVVHIMAGTNDVAGNTGPVSDNTIVDNVRAMIDVAQANRIAVVLASIPPSKSFFWNTAIKPAARIAALNLRLRALASERGAVWVDYYARLADKEGGLPERWANDGVHPNRDGYAIMRPMAAAAIERAVPNAMKR